EIGAVPVAPASSDAAAQRSSTAYQAGPRAAGWKAEIETLDAATPAISARVSENCSSCSNNSRVAGLEISDPGHAGPSDGISAELLDIFEERAANREFDGGESREQAEAAAAIEFGMPPRDVPSGDEKPVDQSDCEALLAELREHGPPTPGAAAEQMEWGATQAWQAMVTLKKQGRVNVDQLGQAAPVEEGSE
ncbi:MAG: hypothetical protein AAF968_24355, partial [Pseudomonadota bacterium]